MAAAGPGRLESWGLRLSQSMLPPPPLIKSMYRVIRSCLLIPNWRSLQVFVSWAKRRDQYSNLLHAHALGSAPRYPSVSHICQGHHVVFAGHGKVEPRRISPPSVQLELPRPRYEYGALLQAPTQLDSVPWRVIPLPIPTTDSRLRGVLRLVLSKWQTDNPASSETHSAPKWRPPGTLAEQRRRPSDDRLDESHEKERWAHPIPVFGICLRTAHLCLGCPQPLGVISKRGVLRGHVAGEVEKARRPGKSVV